MRLCGLISIICHINWSTYSATDDEQVDCQRPQAETEATSGCIMEGSEQLLTKTVLYINEWPQVQGEGLNSATIISSKNNQPHHQINSQRAQVSDLGNIININLRITKSPGNDFALSVCVSVGRRQMQKRGQYRVRKKQHGHSNCLRLGWLGR